MALKEAFALRCHRMSATPNTACPGHAATAIRQRFRSSAPNQASIYRPMDRAAGHSNFSGWEIVTPRTTLPVVLCSRSDRRFHCTALCALAAEFGQRGCSGFARTCRGFGFNFCRRLIRAQALERRLPQQTVTGEAREFNLGDKLRRRPMHACPFARRVRT